MRSKHKKFSNILFLMVLIMLASLCLSTFIVGAEEDDDDDDKALKGKILIGGGYADEPDRLNVTGISPGRAAEYLPAESTFMVDMFLNYAKEKDYFFLTTQFMTVDDFGGTFNASMADRQFMIDLDLQKYTHRMDNDLMEGWDRPFRVDPETASKELEMRVTVLNSGVKYKPSSVPSSVLFLHMNIVGRDGDKQARTLDHCYRCHVNTKTQELDQRTLTLIAGAEYSEKPFAVNYSFSNSTFEDNSSDLTFDYANRRGNFYLEGVQPFAVVPDNDMTAHRIAARYDVKDYGSGYVRFSRRDVENQNTSYSLEKTAFASRVFLRLHEMITLKGQYDYREDSNDTPNSASRKFTRLAGTLAFRPDKTIKLEGRYRYDKMEREGGTEVGETTTKSMKLKALWRPNKQWRISGSHTFVDREDPFGRTLRNSFSRIDDVLLTPFGTEMDITNVMVLHNLSDKSSFNASYHRSHSQGDLQNLEATLWNISLGLNHSFEDGFGVFGNYYYYNNDYEKEIYLGVLAPLLTITPLPYEGEGNTFTVGGWATIGKFNFWPTWSYTTSKSSFNDSNLGDVALNGTDVTIQRLAIQGGIPLSDVLDINAGYYLDDYSDELQPQDDGKIQYFYTWIGYKF